MADLPADGDITADGDYDFDIPGPLTDLTVTGSFGSGTVTLKAINPQDSNAGDIPGGVFVAAFSTVLEGATSLRGRITVAGSTNPTINVFIAKVSR